MHIASPLEARLKAPSLALRCLEYVSVASPFFPQILVSRQPPKPWGKWLVLKRTMAEKNGEST